MIRRWDVSINWEEDFSFTRPGKHTKNELENHHVSWVNPLFRLGHVQERTVNVYERGSCWTFNTPLTWPNAHCEVIQCRAHLHVETAACSHRIQQDRPNLWKELSSQIIFQDSLVGGFKSSSKNQNLSGWWLSHPSEKYDFISWDKIIPNIWKFIKFMFQTTNQLWVSLSCPLDFRERKSQRT